MTPPKLPATRQRARATKRLAPRLRQRNGWHLALGDLGSRGTGIENQSSRSRPPTPLAPQPALFARPPVPAGLERAVADRLPRTADRLPRGEIQLPRGEIRLSRGVSRFPPAASQLSRGVTRFPRGVSQFSRGATRFPRGVSQLSRAANRFPRGVSRLPPAANRFPRGASRSSSAADRFSRAASRPPTGEGRLKRLAGRSEFGKIRPPVFGRGLLAEQVALQVLETGVAEDRDHLATRPWALARSRAAQTFEPEEIAAKSPSSTTKLRAVR
jgi:hypothetical protein